MATRTPGLQTRSQYHAYWGVYTASTDLPNASGNQIGNPEYAKLEKGDVAYVNDDDTRYVCVNPGTLSGGDAMWRAFAVGTDTIRDAHEIVVGCSASPYNDDGSDADFLDAGDGVQLAAALDEASTRGYALDLRIRSCDITLDGAAITGAGFTFPLNVPSNVRVIGAGSEGDLGGANSATIIRGQNTGEQQVMVLQEGATLEDLKIVSPTPVDTNVTGSNVGIVETVTGSQKIVNCAFELGVDPNGVNTRNNYKAIGVGARDGVEIHRCRFEMDDAQATESNPTRAIDFAGSTGEPITINECNMRGMDQGVFMAGDGCTITDCHIFAVLDGVTSVFSTGITEVQNILISDNTIELLNIDPGSAQNGISLVSNDAGQDVRYPRISDNLIVTKNAGATSPLGISLGSGGPGTMTGPIVEGNAVDAQGVGSSIGVEIGVECVSAIVLGNQLDTSGSPISDSGSLTEAAHNIL